LLTKRESMIDLIPFLASMAVLLLGSNFLVNYSVKLAKKMHISPLIIGATAVAIGTSIPEMVVTINSSLAGKGALATGNIVGANIANIGLILGLSFLFGKIRVGTEKTQILARLVFLSGALFTALVILCGGISRLWAVALLIIAAGVFSWEIYAGERGGKAEDASLFTEKNIKIEPLPIVASIVAFSVLAIYLSGQVFVSSALKLAQFFHIQIAIFGLTAVSLGTTLPELTTSLLAVFKKEGKLILGNMLGSIIYNFLLVAGLGGVISALPSISLSSIAMVLFMTSLLALLLLLYKGKVIPRYWGGLFLLGYLFFLSLSL